MTPAAYRRGGRGIPVSYALARSPLGTLLVATTARGVCAVRLGDSATALEADLKRELHSASLERDDARLRPVVQRVLARLDGSAPDARLPLDIRATAFQRKVWQALSAIPRGETRSYGHSARAATSRARGSAAGHAVVSRAPPPPVRSRSAPGGWRRPIASLSAWGARGGTRPTRPGCARWSAPTAGGETQPAPRVPSVLADV